MGPSEGVYWYGSRLGIDEARRLAPFNNATSLQVAAGVLSGIIWSLENPARGIVEPDDIDHKRVLEIAHPYLGQVSGVWARWNSPQQTQDTVTRNSPGLWQFKNMRMQDKAGIPTSAVWTTESCQTADDQRSEILYVNINGETVARHEAVDMIMDNSLRWTGNQLHISGSVFVTDKGQNILILGAKQSGKTALTAAAGLLLNWRIVTEGVVIISDAPKVVLPQTAPLALEKAAINRISAVTDAVIEPILDDRWFPGDAPFLGQPVAYKFHTAVFLILDEDSDHLTVSSESAAIFLKRALACSNALNIDDGVSALFEGLQDSRCVVLCNGHLNERVSLLKELAGEAVAATSSAQ